MKLKPYQDAFGQVLLDYWNHGESLELVERDDGFIAAGDAAAYFASYRSWAA